MPPVPPTSDRAGQLPRGLAGGLVRRALVRRGRVPGLRTAKTTLAAVLSFALADRLGTSAEPVLAPLTALLVVQLTMYETVSHGLGRIVSVLAGVLVAVGVADVVGLTWWSLGAVVAVSLVLGRLLRLGPHLLEVPISAMIVLAVGGSANVAAGRVYETLVGAGVGVAVNVLIAPPLYIQPAADAVAELAERMSTFLAELAEDLRRGWSRQAADHWLDRARDLGSEVARADRTLARTEESSRFNPRGARARDAQPRLRVGLTGLEHSYASLRSLCRALLDRTYFVPAAEQGTAFDEQVRSALADVLDTAAMAVGSIGTATAAPGSTAASSPATVSALAEVGARLPELLAHRDRLGGLLMVDPQADAAAWEQHGALLAAVDRLRVELEAAVRPVDGPWRPVPMADRQRQALRRAVATPLGRARERRTRG